MRFEQKKRISDSVMVVREFDMRRFDWTGTTLVSELSDLGIRPGENWLQQLWNDACDIGIAIRSHHTNRVVRYFLSKTDESGGDVVGFHFKPAEREDQGLPEVLIIND